MAAVSAPQAASALTPPTSSHGASAWNFSVPARQPDDSLSKSSSEYNTGNRLPLSHSNGYSNGYSNSRSNSRPGLPHRNSDSSTRSRPQESALLAAPPRINTLSRQDSSNSDTGSAPTSPLDSYGQSSAEHGDKRMANGVLAGDEEDPERSRWIHRDKLARIESQELQAAGITLPRPRAQSKSSRRENSREPNSAGIRSEQSEPRRRRVGSFPTEEEEEPENNVWDLRLPEEVAEVQGAYRDISGGVKGVSRIPVNKKSPLPIPLQHLERDAPLKRSSGGQVDENELAYPKSRGRSQSIKVLEDYTATPTPGKRLASEHSPNKKGPPVKKAASQPRNASGTKAKVRSTSNATSSQRPNTRSGELNGHVAHSNSISKRPEGDPPWLATMYKPDPRLPPDQQLLPTVAKRLQQEQWEKEGKFGNTYDTDFRPLNDEQPRLPESPIKTAAKVVDEKEPASPLGNLPSPLGTLNTNIKNGSEWPLKPGPKSPALSTGRPGTAGGGNYSVMPRITTPQLAPQILPAQPVIRMPEPPEEAEEKKKGCCAVM